MCVLVFLYKHSLLLSPIAKNTYNIYIYIYLSSLNKPKIFLAFQYLMIQQTPFVRRQVRKLLLFICGSKEKYRQLRDLHTLDSHVRSIKKLLEEQGIFLRAGVVTATSGSALQYDTLINLVSQQFLMACDGYYVFNCLVRV